jgi:PKD repeat protein
LTDVDGNTVGDSVQVSVVNHPELQPIAKAGEDKRVMVDQKVTFDGSASQGREGVVYIYVWDFGNGDSAMGQIVEYAYKTRGTYTATLLMWDELGNYATDDLIVTVVVKNVAPTVNAGPDATINEGSTFTSCGSFTDSDSADWTATVDYGDGSGARPLALNPDKTFVLSHTYADNGAYNVTVTVTDDDGGVGSDTAVVSVNNMAPVVNAGPDTTINEGGVFTSSGSFSDPGADTWTATADYGDGSGIQQLALNPDKTFSLSHTYANNGTYAVTITVTDDDDGVGSGTTMVTLTNVPLPTPRIPALSQWGIIVTAILFAISLVWMRRRRKPVS